MIGLVFIGVGAIVAICVCCWADRIRFVIKLTETSARFLIENMTCLFVPIVGGFCHIALEFIFVVGLIYITSCGQPAKSDRDSASGGIELSPL